jgi:hypothetical protein
MTWAQPFRSMPSPKAGETPAGCQNNLQIPTAAIEYKRLSRTFFAISMERAGTIYTADVIFQPVSPAHCIVSIWPIRNGKSGQGMRS